MGRKTKIDWADASWNPVTGCLHGCAYCYAKKIAERFAGCDTGSTYGYGTSREWRRINPYMVNAPMFEVGKDRPPINVRFNNKTQKTEISVAPYPFGFAPTFRYDKLEEPQHWKTPKNIFVCSMADLFGDWVPAEWIWHVFSAARRAPQHRYLFLTKNPKRYIKLLSSDLLPDDDNFWYGATWETDRWHNHGRVIVPDIDGYDQQTEDLLHPETQYTWNTVPGGNVFPDLEGRHRFISFEPLLCDIMKLNYQSNIEWYIIGAETGKRPGKIIPERQWVDHITQNADRNKAKVFMKESLAILMADDFRQEFPWEVRS